jgi:hypothetical protein
MIRNIAMLAIGLPALWLSIQIFGWIVSGDIELPGVRVQRDAGAVKFWIAIVILAIVCCAMFGLATAFFLGLL